MFKKFKMNYTITRFICTLMSNFSLHTRAEVTSCISLHYECKKWI